MALIKNVQAIPLDQGLDTKTDSKNLNSGAFSVAENIIYESTGAVRKRSGFSLIPNREFISNDLINMVRLSKFKQELLGFSTSELYAYSSTYEKWINKGSLYSVYPTTKSIIKNSSAQTEAGFVYVNGFKVYAYADLNGKVYYSVLDPVSDTFIVSYEEVVAAGENVKVATFGNYVYISYTTGSHLKFRRFNIASPLDLEVERTPAIDYNQTDRMYDMYGANDRIYFAYNSVDAGQELKLLYYREDNTKSSVISFAGEDANSAIDLNSDSNGNIILTWSDYTQVKTTITDASGIAAVLTPTVIESIAGAVNCSAIETSTEGIYKIYYEIDSTLDADHYIRNATVNTAGAVSDVADFKRSVGLAAKVFLKRDRIFVPAVHGSELQSTNFIIDEDGNLASKFNVNVSGGVSSDGGLPLCFNIDDNTVEIVSLRSGLFASENGNFGTLLGVVSTALDFQEKDLFRSAELANNRHIAGGILQMYDGNKVVDHGHQLFPEGIVNSATSGSGGSMSDGTYGYKAVYAWTDNQGNVHRSAPGVGIEVVVSGGGAAQTVDIDIPTLRLTQKENVILELYRTENNGTIYYKVTSIENPIINDPTIDAITFTDTIPDVDGSGDPVLSTNEALYTSGGTLENIAAPSSKFITKYKNRIVLAGLENNEIQYSKIALEGYPVEFNDDLTIKLPADGTAETGVIELEEKLIIFKKSSIYYISGDGPNNLGQEDNFTEIEQISSEIGCVDSGSIIFTNMGIMFKSLKGIYLLTRSLQLVYIGDKVEAFNNYTIKSAEIIGKLNQVRFLTDNNIALVYNYHLNLWSVFTNHAGTSSIAIDTDYYYLRLDGDVFKSDTSIFSDNGAPIKLRIVTGWLTIGQMQSFQRIYKTFVLGSYKSPHKALVRVAYDYVEAFIQEKLLDTSDFINTNTYGEDTPYGLPDALNYGGTTTEGNRYQYRIDLKKQKCQSLKFSIEDSQDNDIGEGLSISALTFEVGAKEGPFKIAKGKQYGTS